MCGSRLGSSAQVVVTVKICRVAGVWTLNGAVTGNPHSELREPQAAEARSFVGGQGPCASVQPVVVLWSGVVYGPLRVRNHQAPTVDLA